MCGRTNEALRREWLLSDRDDLWQQNGQSAGRGVGLRRRAAVAGAAHAVSLAVTGPELSAEHGLRAWKQIGGGELRVTGRSSAR